MSGTLTKLPNDELEEVIVYEDEFITYETMNRPLTRLLINDLALFNYLDEKVTELLEIAKGYGTTKSFTPNIVTYNNDNGNIHTKRLAVEDFGKFYLLKGRVGTASISDENPKVVLPSVDNLTDEYLGQTFTFVCENSDDTVQGKNCRVYSNLDDTTPVKFASIMDGTEYPYSMISNQDESTSPGSHGSFCRLILIKEDSEYKWLFQGSGDFWKPLDSSDSNIYWNNDNL